MKSERTQRYRECVVCEREHIPADYIPLGDLHETEQTLHRYLVKQCEAGKVRRFRLGRLLFVHKDHVDAARRRYAEKQPTTANAGGQASDFGDVLSMVENVLLPGVFDCLNAIAGSLERTEKLAERLTTAIENIATQPKAEPAGTWRDMNGESL